jgi:hypothetical protein
MQDDSRPKKHALDFVLAFVAVVATWTGVLWTRDNNRRSQELLQHQQELLKRQVDDQITSRKLQTKVSEAQVMATMMPYLACNQHLSVTALHVVEHAAPGLALEAANTLVGCAKTPQQRAEVQELRHSAQQQKIKAEFLRLLSNAADYFEVGSDRDAAEEYDQAYQVLPREYEKAVDHSAAGRAREALSQGRNHEAAQLFETAFKNIDLSPEGLRNPASR